MCRHVILVRVVHIVRRYKRNIQLLAHAQKLLVYQLLIRNSVILQLQKVIVLSKQILVITSGLPCLLIQPPHQITRHLTGKAGTQRNDALMILFQRFSVYARPIIKALYKSNRDNFHQICIALIIFCKQHHVIIAVFIAPNLPVQSGIRCHIHLTAKNRIDACRLCFPVKINHTIHDSMIRDRSAIHTKFFDTRHIFFYFI